MRDIHFFLVYFFLTELHNNVSCLYFVCFFLYISVYFIYLLLLFEASFTQVASMTATFMDVSLPCSVHLNHLYCVFCGEMNRHSSTSYFER